LKKKRRCTGFHRNLEYPMNQLRSVNLIYFGAKFGILATGRKKGLEMLPRVFIGKKNEPMSPYLDNRF
jgi:hypothetical protein